MLHHTRPGHALEQLLDLGGARDELVLPELVVGVLDELDEGDEEAPRVGTVHDQALKQDAGDLLLDGLGVRLLKERRKVLFNINCRFHFRVTVPGKGGGGRRRSSACARSDIAAGWRCS